MTIRRPDLEPGARQQSDLGLATDIYRKNQAQRRATIQRAEVISGKLKIHVDASVDDLKEIEVLAVALAMMKSSISEAEAATKQEQESHQRTLRLLREAESEIADKTAALRRADPEGVDRRVEIAVAAARENERAIVADELTKLRADVARQQSEIAELRASKKKLREALERAKEGR
jgi:hypothetical protein